MLICNRPGCGAALPAGRRAKRCIDCNRLQHESWIRKRFGSRDAYLAHVKVRNRTRHLANPAKYCEMARRVRVNLRAKVIEAYGSKCACCGESEPAFLTIEHTRRDGAAHRRSLAKSNSAGIYWDLKRRGWPTDGYELLCFNCNHASWKLGICPHRKAA